VTLFLSFRERDVAGSIAGPQLLEGDGTADPLALRLVSDVEIALRVAGRNLLFAAHGFNVSGPRGARSLARLEPALGLGPADLYIAVLWPGDWWVPVVNYPFEGATSMECGRRLALWCGQRCTGAASFSFVSHSLGARLVLEAAMRLDLNVRSVCLTAGAINDDCLATEYAAAAESAAAVSVLASRRDKVLKIAFRIGDPIADLLHDDHSLSEEALGTVGPAPPVPPVVVPPWQIADKDDYGHGDYLPPGDAVEDAAARAAAKWPRPAAFMGRAFRGEAQSWPAAAPPVRRPAKPSRLLLGTGDWPSSLFG
jgi:pimeloyl-ACP methyl ester carboxylesterase